MSPPLSIGDSSGSGTGNNSNNTNLRPSIHSAPIRSRAPTRPTPRAIPPTRIVPQIAIPPQPQYYYVSTPYQQYYPAQIVGATPTQPVFQPLPRSQLRQVNPRVRMIPLSSTTTHFGRRTLQQGPSQLPPGAILQQQQQQQSLPLQQQPQQQPQSQQAISLQSTAPNPNQMQLLMYFAVISIKLLHCIVSHYLLNENILKIQYMTNLLKNLKL